MVVIVDGSVTITWLGYDSIKLIVSRLRPHWSDRRRWSNWLCLFMLTTTNTSALIFLLYFVFLEVFLHVICDQAVTWSLWPKSTKWLFLWLLWSCSRGFRSHSWLIRILHSFCLGFVVAYLILVSLCFLNWLRGLIIPIKNWSDLFVLTFGDDNGVRACMWVLGCLRSRQLLVLLNGEIARDDHRLRGLAILLLL